MFCHFMEKNNNNKKPKKFYFLGKILVGGKEKV